jgi:uroporphyrinogen-III decarboxylase
MTETMTHYERIIAAYELKEPDRVPVIPINSYFLPYYAGMTIRQAQHEPDRLVQAHLDHQEFLGDAVHPFQSGHDHLGLFGRTGWDQTTLDWRIFEKFPPEGNLPNLYEKDVIEDYQDVFERGFSTLLFNRKLENDIWKRSVRDFLYFEFDYLKVWAAAWRRFVEQSGISLLLGARACHPLDLLQYYRGIFNLVTDLYEQPEDVKAMCEWLSEYEAVRAMGRAMTMGAGEVPGADTILFINGGPPGLPPKMFDEFYFPYAKKMIDMFVTRGFKVQNHWDTDLTPHLRTIAGLVEGLPKGKVVMDFEKTNMKKAKELLGDKMCIAGNVPVAMLIYGTVAEVEDYCKTLIRDCAEGGGYMLGGECDIPWDARPENLLAMVEAAKKFGQYKSSPGTNKEWGARKGFSPTEKRILKGIKEGLKPPSQEELDRVTARWLFGNNTDMMMKYAPWSFILTKIMWKKGEEPWGR